MHRKSNGLSIVEIIVAVMVLSLVILFVFAVYFPGIKFRSFVKNEIDAHSEALRWLEKVRARAAYEDIYMTNSTWVDLYRFPIAPGTELLEDYNNRTSDTEWPMNRNVDGLTVEYRTEDKYLRPQDQGGEAQKKISVKVRWSERAPIEEE